jgi:spore maturation protein CgeB
MGCFACGGFVLFDYKEDFHQSMGDTGDEVMYRTLDELNAKVDEFLANPRKRRDVARYLQYRVTSEFNFASLSKKILVDEPAWRRA